MTIRRARWLAAALALLMAAAACSGGSDDETTATTEAPTTTVSEAAEPTPTTTNVSDAPAVTTTNTEPAAETTTTPTTEAEAEAAGTNEEQSAAENGDASTETGTPEPTGDDASETGESTESDESEPDEAHEAEEPVEPNYKNRSAGSVFPKSAYLDHDAITALFPHCPPQEGRSFGWVDDVFAYWDETYARWDTESQLVKGDDGRSYRIATGWWTDKQLEMFSPGDGITAASARRHAGYRAEIEYPTMWPEGNVPQDVHAAELYVSHWPMKWSDGRYTFENLYRRLESIGYRDTEEDPSTSTEALAVIRDDGVPGNGPNPAGISVGHMLAEWMITRYQHPPATREPAAWAMRTLLTEREALCVADAMTAVCNGQGEEPLSPVLDRDHRFGRVLWSLVCPEA